MAVGHAPRSMGWPLARKGCRCPEGVPTPGTVDRWLGMMAVLTWNNHYDQPVVGHKLITLLFRLCQQQPVKWVVMERRVLLSCQSLQREDMRQPYIESFRPGFPAQGNKHLFVHRHLLRVYLSLDRHFPHRRHAVITRVVPVFGKRPYILAQSLRIGNCLQRDMRIQ